MDKYIEIVIEGVSVPISDSEDFPFNTSYRITDDISSISGASADRLIKIPSNKITDSIYRNYADVKIINEDAYSFKETFVKVNGVVVFSGKSKLQRASLTGAGRFYTRVSETYSLLLVGTNANWTVLLKDVCLGDFDYGRLEYTSRVVRSSRNNSYANGDEYAFGLIKWKSWNNETLTSLPYSVKVEYSEFTPLLFIKSILDKIGDYIGYTFKGNFYDSYRLERAVHVVPPIEKYPPEYSQEYLTVEANLGNGIDITNTGFPFVPLFGVNTTFLSPSASPGMWDPGNVFYTAQEAGFVKVEISLTVINSTPADDGQLVLFGVFKNGSNGATFPQLGYNGYTGNLVGLYQKGERIFKVNKGDIIGISYAYFGNNTITIKSDIKITGEANFQFGNTIDFKYLLRDWKALDLLNGLSDIFGILFMPDESEKVIYMNTRSSFTDTPDYLTPLSLVNGFYDEIAPIDYSDKIDLSKKAKLQGLNKKKLQVLKYQTDGESESKKELNTDIEIYQSNYDLGETGLQGVDTKEVRYFAKTVHVFDELIQLEPSSPLGNVGNPTPLVPLIYNGNYKESVLVDTAEYEVKPRIMYFMGERNGYDGVINVDDPSSSNIMIPPALFFVNYNDRYGTDPSLSFDDQIINNINVPGLTNVFYLSQLKGFKNNKVLREKILWSTLMINNLDFRQLITINNTNFQLQEIQDFSLTKSRSIDTILIPNTKATEADVLNIQNSLLNGVISKIE